jgi:hexosaminidase
MMGRIVAKDSLVFSLDTKDNIVKEHRAGFDNDKQTIALKGGNSFVNTSFPGIGYGYTVSFYINPSKDNLPGAVLFESKDAVVFLNAQGSGKLGFSREKYAYEFNYTVPSDTWTHITIKGNNKGTSLYVNGVLKEKLEGAKRTFDNGKQTAKVQTLFFPLQYIGSSSNACKAMISHLKVFNCELNDTTIGKLAETDEVKK